MDFNDIDLTSNSDSLIVGEGEKLADDLVNVVEGVRLVDNLDRSDFGLVSVDFLRFYVSLSQFYVSLS